MADPMMRNVLAELTALRAEVALQKRKRHRPRHLIPLLAVALLVALAPLSLLAATPFTDLTGGVHDANIDAIYNAGVTTGCVPNQAYCPTANVTREEMASFLARLGGLGSNPPVANAKTAQSATNAQLAQTVPDGSVTAAKLSASGSTPEQALVSTGSGVSWQGLPAATFGETATEQGSHQLTPCVATVVVALPFSVTTAARLYVSGTGGYNLLSGNLQGADIWVRLRDAGNTTTLATTQPGRARTATLLSVSGLLLARADPYAGSTTTFVAAPGSYLLQFVVSNSNGNCTGFQYIDWPSLTYLAVSPNP